MSVHGQPVHGQPVHGQPVHGLPTAGGPPAGHPPAVYQPPSGPRPGPLQTVPAAPPANPLYPRPDDTEPRQSLNESLEMLRRGKWYILAMFLIVFGGIAYYTFTATPSFEAYSLLMLDTRQAQADDAPVFENAEGPSFSSRKLSNQALILGQSLLIAQRTAEQLLALERVPSTGAPITVLTHPETPKTPDALAALLQAEYVTVTAADKEVDADAIWITAKSPSAAEAALIANLYAEEYVRRTRETSRQRLTASREFLEEQLEKRRGELQSLEDRIQDYMSQRGAVALSEEAQYSVTQLAELDAAIDEARIERSIQSASLEALREQLGELQPQLTDRIASGAEREIEQTQTRIAELERRVEEIYFRNPLLRDNPSSSPELQDQLRQIDQHKARVRELSEQYVDEVFAVGGIDLRSNASGMAYLAQLKRQLTDGQVALSAAEAKLQALTQRRSEVGTKLRAIPAQSMELAQLQRGQQSAERLYLYLEERLQEARIAEQSEIGYAQIIRPAIVPTSPTSPKKGLNLGLGALLGLLLGLGTAVVRQKLDARVYTPEDLRGRARKVLGVIPDMRRTVRKEFGRNERVYTGWNEVSAYLMTFLLPYSPVAEAYRRLLTNILHHGEGRPPQSLVVTSAEMGAGKSVTAANLAVTAAQTGKRTLLIDADLHRPTMHDLLGIQPNTQMSAMLFDGRYSVSIDNFATGIDNLFAISLRDHAGLPAELLSSKKMKALLERLHAAFDLIVFDSPPSLVAADASLLATQCDATILIANSRRSDGKELQEAAAELTSVGANVIGTVLNRFDPAKTYGYKSAYRDRDRYYNQA